MNPIKFAKITESGKYDGSTIRWLDKGDHYELIFTDDFITPSSTARLSGNQFPVFRSGNALLTDIIMDMRDGCKSKELHVFVGSFGGEVAALNMILQQLLTYEYRVGINLGTACSCGWMLLFACQERYVSPFSQAMYHDISSIRGGKHSELKLSAEFMGRWQKELLKITDTAQVLTDKELELGRTTEVWFTGQQLIERGAAKDYSEYRKRMIPQPFLHCIPGGENLYCKFPSGWHEVDLGMGKPVSYAEVVAAFNAPPKEMSEFLESMSALEPAPESAPEPVPAKPKRKSSKKKGDENTAPQTPESPGV